MSIRSKIKYWYLGGPLPTRERLSDTATALRAPNTFKPSLSARFAQWVVKNILVIVPIIISLFFIYLQFFSNGSPKSESKREANNSQINIITHNTPFLVKIKPLTKKSIRPQKTRRLI